ncbi:MULTISPECIES: ABC transporter permease [unclassified Acinetobacter]|uniref:ABC transporter permease n=1 Tax=unclassified Acinetobacter TaxID=196816 RepID=UPI0029350688|nr:MULTISPECIES: FtsX-like permease family protein [unclassified Acinetobacter]WOE31450.1 FtsX-like permease family protein [Acinetobacter sp. SAAs470]WOE39646.1 FtsX-like permease family protein [Acinetobacter sp. SAAs474]
MLSLFPPLLKQSFKTSGIYLLIIALTLAISTTTALKFSHTQIQQAVALQAAEMLAADLLLTDQQAIDEKWQSKAAQQNLTQSKVTLFSSMAHTQDQFVMVNVKAVDDAFPLRGKLQLMPQQARIRPGEVWLSQRAMDLLHVKIGDNIHIADGQFKVAAKITHDSNQELGFSAFSPTVMIAQSDVATTNAIQTGSRIEYRLLLAGDAAHIKAFENDFKQLQQANSTAVTKEKKSTSSSSLKIRNASEGNTRLMKPIAHLDTFLQLTNILTILLCGIAIALTAQRYVQQNQDHIALLRCIGAKKSQILMAYMALLAVVILIAMLLGSLMGIGFGFVLLQLMLQLIPHLQLQFSALDLLSGPLPIALFTSVMVLLGFVLPSLWQLLRTPPIRVIRQQGKSISTWLWMLVTGTLSLVIFSVILTERFVLSLLVIGAIIVLCGLLYAVIWLLLKVIRAGKSKLASYIRLPYQTAFQITALALGLSLITVLMVLRNDLIDRWQQQLPAGTPNQFVYGLPPFELNDFKAKIKENHWRSTPLYPNIKGRLVAKNKQPFSAQLIQSNNSLRRELNLTQTNHYPENNQIVEGQAHLAKAGEVSVEYETAQALGIKVGDQLTFSLPEGLLNAKVVNLRTVEWESFSPNFFFIFSPQTMDENAGSYLGSFYVPPQQKNHLIPIIQQFSNTVFIDVSLILEEIKSLVTVLAKIISFLALLVSISGILVLIACLNLLMDERKREIALLRSFGASKRQLKNMLTLEIGLMGLLSGIVSCVFAEVVSAIASIRMDLPIQLHGEIWLILPLAMTLLCAVIGRYRLGYLTHIPPLKSLREMNPS